MAGKMGLVERCITTAWLLIKGALLQLIIIRYKQFSR